jgi:hypothetical protein
MAEGSVPNLLRPYLNGRICEKDAVMTKPTKKPPVVPGKPARPSVNPKVTNQTRKVMGKHYAAKYGVRKERGRG